MADSVVTNFLASVSAKSKKAVEWFKDIVNKTRAAAFTTSSARNKIIKDRNIGQVKLLKIGRLYLFQYDAKMKETLPYWDVWPLIFPFDYAPNGFYGINLHYLAPNARTELMIRLIKAQGGGGNMTEDYKLKLSYDIITRFKPAKPCIKRYLFGQVQGKGLYGISGEDWSYAASLPLQKFRGASENTVWGDSKAMY